MLGEFIALFQSEVVLSVIHFMWESLPVWLPIILIMLWFDLWREYKQREYIKAQGSVVLEIKLPREVTKSPKAMELFLNNLWQTGVGSLLDVYWKGRVRPWFSLELVSIDGKVHFFIWTQDKFKSLVETQLYAQFPDIEVHEVADYTRGVYYDPNKYNFGWFGQIGLTKEDAFPIKTYVDYGLEKDPKEEHKVDPLVSVLEYLGAMRKGEQAWIQILVQAHTKEGLKYGRLFPKKDWKDGVKDAIAKIRKESTTEESKFPMLTPGQSEMVAAIERTLSKYAFDTMIRATYFAENEVFDANNIGGLLGSFRQFSSNTLNGFKPLWHAKYDYPWQDFRGKKMASNMKSLLEAYKRRSFFYTPFKYFNAKPFILTTEELATLFHFPSAEVAATPTLSRVPSKRSEAPGNLPI